MIADAVTAEPATRTTPRLIAYHLPQFHPTPENDSWWGKGFTEWTNVAKARPLFPGHEQPKLPGELGFYDLRLPEARASQAELAARYGIEGFCYWHYWFQGRRLLNRPVDAILGSGEPDFPFCLGWANESWSRRWMGGEAGREILMEQAYSAEDDRAHARWLAEAFADPRYIRVEGRPLFLIYRPHNLPEPGRTIDAIRDECVKLGLPEPFLIGSSNSATAADLRPMGFDITEYHEPHLLRMPLAGFDGKSRRRLLWNLALGVPSRRLKVYRYQDYVDCCWAELERIDHPYLPCCVVRWDNTPRRGRDGIVMVDCSPEAFSAHLSRCIEATDRLPASRRIVFLNAWNEWAEGMYLEPDRRHGLAFLEVVADVLRRSSGSARTPAPVSASGPEETTQ